MVACPGQDSHLARRVGGAGLARSGATCAKSGNAGWSMC